MKSILEHGNARPIFNTDFDGKRWITFHASGNIRIDSEIDKQNNNITRCTNAHRIDDCWERHCPSRLLKAIITNTASNFSFTLIEIGSFRHARYQDIWYHEVFP